MNTEFIGIQVTTIVTAYPSEQCSTVMAAPSTSPASQAHSDSCSTDAIPASKAHSDCCTETQPQQAMHTVMAALRHPFQQAIANTECRTKKVSQQARYTVTSALGHNPSRQCIRCFLLLRQWGMWDADLADRLSGVELWQVGQCQHDMDAVQQGVADRQVAHIPGGSAHFAKVQQAGPHSHLGHCLHHHRRHTSWLLLCRQ